MNQAALPQDGLDEGAEVAVWIDSDIVAARPYARLFGDAPAETMIVAEEALWGDACNVADNRTAAWGMDVGRVLDRCVNSCVVRVTRFHRPILERWRALLASPEYLAAQRSPGGLAAHAV